MRVRKVKIGIKSLEDVLENAKKAMKKLEKGEKVRKSRGIYFENLDTFRRALTEKRLEILHVIKEERPSSVYELARILGRDMKNVSEDVNYLVRLGLVETKEKRKEKEGLSPRVNYDVIQLEVAV